MRSIFDQGHQEMNVVLGSEVKSTIELRTTCQSEGKITKVNACTGRSQDMSQISGPDGKSRSTPLSQIGFRDPASVGAGQQLTLLSLEVSTMTYSLAGQKREHDILIVSLFILLIFNFQKITLESLVPQS